MSLPYKRCGMEWWEQLLFWFILLFCGAVIGYWTRPLLGAELRWVNRNATNLIVRPDRMVQTVRCLETNLPKEFLTPKWAYVNPLDATNKDFDFVAERQLFLKDLPPRATWPVLTTLPGTNLNCSVHFTPVSQSAFFSVEIDYANYH